MKKHLLLLVFALTATIMQAQNAEWYTLMFHDSGFAYFLQGNMQQHDGDLIISTYVFEDIGNYDYIPLGNVFYKMSPSSLTITDSLFIADPTEYPNCFLAPNPHGEGNIRIYLEYHEECDSTFLRLSHFPDNDLHINPDEDVVAPLCEGNISGGSLVDCSNDLVISYSKERENFCYDEYLARFGLDGSLKCQALSHENDWRSYSQVRVLKESPLKYYQWTKTEINAQGYENLAVYVIDSLFNNNPVVISSILSEEIVDPYHSRYEFFSINGDTDVIPVGGDDILVAAQYVYDTNNSPTTSEYGVTVAKYDLRTMQLKDYIVFNDYAGYYRRAQCVGIKMMTDGSVYFIYKEEGYPDESIMIVKMDTDLHVDWKRFCKTENNVISMLEHPIVFKDEQMEEKGISWVGQCYNSSFDHYGLLCFLLNHDGPVGMDESGIVVRPYAFYPNPAQEQLHVQYSPDVQPAQVELYDLQGRLVHTQHSGLESIDMGLLPAGTYTMRVMLEDGKSYSDKVVKE